MSSRSEADCSPVSGSLEACGSRDSTTAEADDVDGCIEKLCKFGTVRVPIFDEGEAREWLKSIQSASKVTWRVLRTFRGGQKNVFKTEYKCLHNVRRTRALTTKSTNCPARLLLILKRAQLAKGLKSRSKDALISSHPLVASLQREHNHPVEALTSNEELPSVDIAQPSAGRHRLQFRATGQYAAPPTWFSSLQENRKPPETVEASSRSTAHYVGRQSKASHTQHAPVIMSNRLAAEGLRAAESSLPHLGRDVEQGSEDGAVQEKTDELRQTVRLLHAFVDEQAATPGGLKGLSAMNKAIKRLGNGSALERAMLAFGK